MQLNPPARCSALRNRLGAAACLLLASGIRHPARAETAGTTQLDATALVYGERSRAAVIEPIARITRVLPDGQSFSAQFGLDVITGSSPTGASPSGRAHTVTSASGQVRTVAADELPMTKFSDTRGVIDGEWKKPFGPLTSTIGAHFSREKDYQSLGGSGTLALDLFERRTTLTLGGSVDRDAVFPTGGTTAGLTDPTVMVGLRSNPKRVSGSLLGVSQVMTRRWLLSMSAARTSENGYLTEPYKLISLVDRSSGLATRDLTEQRPGTRTRQHVLGTSVYHLQQDVVHLSYRYYWDDWGVRSHMADVKVRRDLGEFNFLQPHVRLYAQSASDFYRSALVEGAPLPRYATNDTRLAKFASVTLGATYGLRLADYPGEWTIRAEYMGQFGDRHPSDAVGVQRRFDLFPTVNVGTLVLGYSVSF